jgi:hypothetical protein
MSCFTCADAGIGVLEDGRRYEDSGARGEFNDETEVPKHKVTTTLRIIVPQGAYGAPTPNKVSSVNVWETDGKGSKVECDSGP